MESELEVNPGFAAEITRRDASAAGWLDGLPDLWRSLSAQWGLSAAGAVKTGKTSLIVPVTTTNRVRAALKLVSPVMSMEAEASALHAFGGHGAVTLLEADDTQQAMLLEWIDGPTLEENTDRAVAMSIAGRISRDLAAAAPPHHAPRLAGQAPGWLAQLRTQHDLAQRSGLALSDQHLDLAENVIELLATDDTGTLTHGDLSLSNILQADTDRWVAIDPLLLVGTVANEAHTVVRSHLHAIDGTEDPLALLNAGPDVSPTQRTSTTRWLSVSRSRGTCPRTSGRRRTTVRRQTWQDCGLLCRPWRARSEAGTHAGR